MRLGAVSLAALTAVTYIGAKPAAAGSTIQEDFPCKGP